MSSINKTGVVLPLKACPCIRVFLVDDHPLILWGLEKLIDGERPRMCVVGHAANIEDTLDKIETLDPDVVLLDLRLGNESGLNIIERLAAKPKQKVLVFTGMGDPSMLDKAIIAGARGVVTKAEPAETILRAIEKVHDGELWLHHAAISRILSELHRGTKEQSVDSEVQKLSTLTPKEREVFDALVANIGAPAKKVAELLHISEHTLRNHCSSIYDKIGVASRMQLFVYAQKHALAGPHQNTEVARSMTTSVEGDDDVDRGAPAARLL